MKAPSFVVPVAVRSMTLGAAALAVAAPAQAQWSTAVRNVSNAGTAVYEWQGRVDQEIRLQLRDDRANVIRVGPRETIANGGRALSVMPRQPGQLTVERLEGRGQVTVIQQPSAANGYTAVVRMVDGDAGAAAYHMIAYWQPTGGYSSGGYGNSGGGRGGRDGNDGRGDASGRGGWDRDGYDRGGYDRNGYDRGGYDRGGFDRNGYDRNGYDRNGRDRRGGYRNGNGGNARGHAYGHDKQDARDDRRDGRDDRADRRDDRRDKRDDKRDKQDDKRDKRDDKRDQRDDRRDGRGH